MEKMQQTNPTQSAEKKEQMISYIVEKLPEMPARYVAYVYGLVQGLCED